MPSSPQIYGTLALPGKETGLATLGDLAAMRDVQAQRQAQAQQAQAAAQKAEREAQEQAQIQDIFTRHNSPEFGLDKKAVAQELYNVNPAKAKEFEAFHDKELEDEYARQDKDRERELKDMDFDFGLFQGIDPNNPAQVRSAKARMRDRDFASTLPDVLDPGLLTWMQTARLKAGEYQQYMRDARSQAKDGLELVLRHYAGARDQGDIDEALEEAKAVGVGKEFAQLGLKPIFDPAEVQHAASFITGPQKESAAGLQSKELMVNGKPAVVNFDPSTGAYTPQTGVAPIPPRAPASSSGLGGTPENAKLIAQSIIAGRQPPELTGLYGNTDDVRAELERKGYDLTRARQDWVATQKQLATLNGAQQTRLRQAVTFTKDSLDIVQGLANEWKGGRFPLLNKLNLSAAKNGVYGQDVQSVASRLDAQINDIVSELGTVYKGGNSSTDHSLQLAAENLKSNWSQKTMTDAINLIRKNLQIRENSINNTVAVANAGNPYAPQIAAPTAPKMSAEELIKKYGGK